MKMIKNGGLKYPGLRALDGTLQDWMVLNDRQLQEAEEHQFPH